MYGARRSKSTPDRSTTITRGRLLVCQWPVPWLLDGSVESDDQTFWHNIFVPVLRQLRCAACFINYFSLFCAVIPSFTSQCFILTLWFHVLTCNVKRLVPGDAASINQCSSINYPSMKLFFLVWHHQPPPGCFWLTCKYKSRCSRKVVSLPISFENLLKAWTLSIEPLP
jgi:hypothetical protein